MCTVLLPPGDNPIAVNEYIISKKFVMVEEFKGAMLLVPKLIIRHSSETASVHIIGLFCFEKWEFYKNPLPQISAYNSVLPSPSTCTVHVSYRDFNVLTITGVLHTTHGSSLCYVMYNIHVQGRHMMTKIATGDYKLQALPTPFEFILSVCL